ncbi:hypothetical protein LZ30DRAFT_694905 [Colletotrichum cereale]|nr:hypothetical protein LZ30DRAFT_694905 [Colletotrichum cereale]
MTAYRCSLSARLKDGILERAQSGAYENAFPSKLYNVSDFECQDEQDYACQQVTDIADETDYKPPSAANRTRLGTPNEQEESQDLNASCDGCHVGAKALPVLPVALLETPLLHTLSFTDKKLHSLLQTNKPALLTASSSLSQALLPKTPTLLKFGGA